MAKPAAATEPWLQDRVGRLRADGGSTNFAAGLDVSLNLFRDTPSHFYRKIWLLSDGYPNEDVDRIMPMVQRAYNEHVNINTIGFGRPGDFDESLLRRISAATHNGKFVPVNSLRALTDALVIAGAPGVKAQQRRPECAVLCIDCSGSMLASMDGSPKIAVVQHAILQLLNYKQKCFT